MKIEKIKINDLEQINTLEKNTFNDDSFSKDTIEQLIHNHAFFYKIVNIHKKIGGFIIVLEEERFTLNIINFLIKEDYRKMGLGSYLLSHVLIEIDKQQLFKRIILNVRTTNMSAINLYKKYNFRIIKEINNYYHKGDNAFLMELKI